MLQIGPGVVCINGPTEFSQRGTGVMPRQDGLNVHASSPHDSLGKVVDDPTRDVGRPIGAVRIHRGTNPRMRPAELSHETENEFLVGTTLAFRGAGRNDAFPT